MEPALFGLLGLCFAWPFLDTPTGGNIWDEMHRSDGDQKSKLPTGGDPISRFARPTLPVTSHAAASEGPSRVPVLGEDEQLGLIQGSVILFPDHLSGNSVPKSGVVQGVQSAIGISYGYGMPCDKAIPKFTSQGTPTLTLPIHCRLLWEITRSRGMWVDCRRYNDHSFTHYHKHGGSQDKQIMALT
ncbi:hypothetical protein PG997_010491 [Apiospora hydei]|uniref:Uncharacterized protein n=1 Tax=Apiospora hydei TaxID=1337664 RepID=A0ABR1W132_9PEZI